LRDESDRRGMSIVMELKRNAEPHKVLNQLYKYTPLQSTFGVHLLALVNNEPRALSLKRALTIFIEHRQEVIVRRTRFELDKARRRAHILEGLLIALANLDAVIQTIRESPDADVARERLVERFKLSELQAQAILDLQLRRLAALERQKIEDEQREMLARIASLEDLLASPKKILSSIKEDLEGLGQKYGDARRTRIAADATEELNEEDLVADVPVLVSITARGYIKRVSPSVYRTRGRGGRGVSGQELREEDEVLTLLHTRTLHTVLFFSDRGKVYSQRAHQIPEAGRTDRGVPIINLLPLESGERITAAVTVPGFDTAAYFTMVTLNGRIKRVALSEFASVRPSGLIAINLEKGDELGWVRLTSGQDEVIFVTRHGRALRISENEVRSMGRAAAGVTGIRMKVGDRVAAVEVVEPGGCLLIVTEFGFGKRTDLEEYPPKGRATGGVIAIDQKNLDKTGYVAVARVVQEVDEVTAITNSGMVLRLKVSTVRPSGRSSRGVHLMNIAQGTRVTSLARLDAVEE
jgi:DNA gyrase subunit A